MLNYSSAQIDLIRHHWASENLSSLPPQYFTESQALFFSFRKAGLKAWTIPLAGRVKGLGGGSTTWLFSLYGNGGQLLGLGMLPQPLHGHIPSSVTTLPCRGPIRQSHHPTVCILDGWRELYRGLQQWLGWQEAWRWTLAVLGGGPLGDYRQLDRGGAGGGGGGGGNRGRSGRSAVAGVDWMKVVVVVGRGILKLVLDTQCHRRRLLLLLHLA